VAVMTNRAQQAWEEKVAGALFMDISRRSAM